MSELNEKIVKKIKVLALCDSPTVSTGFAQVSKNIFNCLVNTGEFDITVLGINHTGSWYDQEKLKYKIYPAMPVGYTDVYGRGRFLQILQGKDTEIKPPFDIVFTIQDTFILCGDDSIANGFNLSKSLKQLQYEILKNPKVDKKYLFSWVGYYPVDAQLKTAWVRDGIHYCDFPVSYTNYGKKEILRNSLPVGVDENGNKMSLSLNDKLSVIYHGTNTKDFHPISNEESKQFRKDFFSGEVKDDHFLIVNVNRNQIRKDMLRTLIVFKEYSKINPKAFLYIHCKAVDNGGDIWELAEQVGLQRGVNLAVSPESFNERTGMPIEIVNKIYNCADAIMTTTHGEGWGLSLTEAMACKKPIIAPFHTSIPEIFGIPSDSNIDLNFIENNLSNIRGIPVKNSGVINYGYVDTSRVRPVVDVNDFVEKLDFVYKNKEKVNNIIENAYKWVNTLTWEDVTKDWIKVFKSAYNDLQNARNSKQTTIGRNEPCFCGSGKKYKDCHGK